MPIYNFVFWFCGFFLLGVFLISVFNNFLIIPVFSLLVSGYLIFSRKYIFALLALAVILGAGYYRIFDSWQKTAVIPFNRQSEIQGLVKKSEQSVAKQVLVIILEPPYNGKIKITAKPYPEFNYGDLININGSIQEPPAESAPYYAKEGIFGLMSNPEIELIKSGQGNYVLEKLLRFKNRIIEIFKNSLPQEKAAFLAGLTLGEREDFSKEFQQKMKLSGTTHLVALSGYNISVIVIAIGLLLRSYFSETITFYLSALAITLFVLMAGAEASVVRAAIMGIIALFARQSQRLPSVRNAIMITAFLMILINPKILAFDLGFQLSFAALLGIIYILPVLQKALKFKNPGILNWKNNLLTTFSAQVAVVPFLLGNFGLISLTSLFSNILIAEAIPPTMGLGFLMAGLGLISGFLAKIVGLVANLFLGYELWIIDVFSKLTLPIAAKSFGFTAAVIYYSTLIGLIYALNKKLR